MGVPTAYIACGRLWPKSNLCGRPTSIAAVPIDAVLGATSCLSGTGYQRQRSARIDHKTPLRAAEERCVNVPSQVEFEVLCNAKRASPTGRPSTTLSARSKRVVPEIDAVDRRPCSAPNLTRSKRNSFIRCESTCLCSIAGASLIFRTRRST